MLRFEKRFRPTLVVAQNVLSWWSSNP